MRIPTYGNNKVVATAMGNNFRRGTATAASFGSKNAASLTSAGTALKQVSSKMIDAATAEQTQLNSIKVQESLNDIDSSFASEMNSIKSMRGKESSDVSDYADVFSKDLLKTRLQELDNDEQRQLLSLASKNTINDFRTSAEVHRKEQQIVRKDEALETGVINARNKILVNVLEKGFRTDSLPVIFENTQQIKDLTRARNEHADKAVIEKAVEDASNELYNEVITNLIANDRHFEATQFIEGVARFDNDFDTSKLKKLYANNKEI